MHELKINHSATWKEFEDGNISATKSEIPFVSIGADHACEHLNRMLKVHSGLVGISNNSNARQRFFLASPEISHLSNEFKGQFELQMNKPEGHHDVQPSVIRQKHQAVNKIKAAILTQGNPFAAEGSQIYNFITNAYVPQEYVPQILNADEIGQKLYENYVAERINGDTSLWAPFKKQNNKMYMSGSKKLSVKICDQTVDMKETENLYGHLMGLTRSNRDIDQKDAVGNYEFTLTPRALFAPDGSILAWSKLIHILEKLASTVNTNESLPSSEWNDCLSTSLITKIAIVDGMVLVQKVTQNKKRDIWHSKRSS